MRDFLQQFSGAQPMIAAITASELLHGVERAADPTRKAARAGHVEQVLNSISILPFDLQQARVHARIWAELADKGQMVGARVQSRFSDIECARVSTDHRFESCRCGAIPSVTHRHVARRSGARKLPTCEEME
jgi:predicted nucleic acid-binding protein